MKALTKSCGWLILGLASLSLALAPAVAPAADEEGFKPIFDGKTLNGWDGNPQFWRAEDGAIVGQTTKENPAKGNTFLIWRGGTPGDFELRVEFKLHNHNSGVQFRSWDDPAKWGKWVVGGYQADMDESNQYTGALYGENYRGLLAKAGEKTVIGEDHKPKLTGKVDDPAKILSYIHKVGWNEYRIVAKGNHITLALNGHPTVDVTDEDQQMRRATGIIALQLHAGPPMKVEFRNLRLKEFGTPASPTKSDAAKKKIVFLAGGPSHGYGDHEHYAGCTLLAKCLKENVPNVETVVSKGWPKDETVLDGADAIVVFSDGDGAQPTVPHLDEVDKLMKKGVGIAFLHYAVEVPKGKPGNCMKDWIGGYFETFWSVNPTWKADFKEFPKHPVANGLKPFVITDEWYYHMRFIDHPETQGVTPILGAIPPDSTRGPDGDRSGNPEVRARKGMPEIVAWVRQRADGGRGFGFTGGHFHWNWGNDNFRKVVLNGIAWIAKVEVPPDGVPSKTPTLDDLLANQDKARPGNFDLGRIQKMLDQWKK